MSDVTAEAAPKARMDAAHAVLALGAGFVFAIGLAISGMTNPAKVLGFLDVQGDWDPSLLLVMGSAVPVHALAWWWLRNHEPVLGDARPSPPAGRVDARLIAGATIFGIGWGISGVCPGPALTNLTVGIGAVGFVVAMIVGVLLARLVPTGSVDG